MNFMRRLCKSLTWFIATLVLIDLSIYFLPALFPPAVRSVYAQSYGIDPCQWNGVAKSSVVLNIASATTTQLVALSAGKQVFVCGFNFTMVGTAQTLAFEYGTGASCGTGTTLLTGAMADGTVSDIVVGMYPGSTIMTTPSGNALCALTTGTVSAQGLLTYVQQ